MQPKTMVTFSEGAIFAAARLRMERDGAGVRTLLVFADCPLRCRYCLNRYTWDGTKAPKRYTPRELVDQVAVDSLYFKATGGGVTFGGGEPLLHPHFIAEFIDLSPRDWSFMAETSLAVDPESVRLVMHKIDHFFVDIKSMDEEIYHAYTGGELSLAKCNLVMLLDAVGADRITVRVPVIKGYAAEESRDKSIEMLKALGVTRFDPFVYRVSDET